MTYRATVLKIMIASPSDVATERQVVRDVIHEWNAIHSQDRGVVLLPVGWDTHAAPAMGDRPQAIINAQVLRDSDLLIAAFWTRLGSPTGTSPSGTVEEIYEHVSTRKPAMIYFSLAPVRLDSVEDDQYQALKAFREECSRRGLYETYETMEEFRQKLFRQLSQTIIREYPQLNIDLPDADGPPPRPALPTVSAEAKALLLEASQDKNGLVLTLRTFSGVSIKTNGRDFVTDRTPREVARWEGAVQELVELSVLQPQGTKGEIYKLTHRGYELADLLRVAG